MSTHVQSSEFDISEEKDDSSAESENPKVMMNHANGVPNDPEQLLDEQNNVRNINGSNQNATSNLQAKLRELETHNNGLSEQIQTTEENSRQHISELEAQLSESDTHRNLLQDQLDGYINDTTATSSYEVLPTNSDTEARISELNEKLAEYETLLRNHNEQYINVSEVDSLRSHIVSRLHVVRRLLNETQRDKDTVFSQMLAAVIKRDTTIAECQQFKTVVQKSLISIREQLENTEVKENGSEDSGETLRDLNTQVLELQSSLEQTQQQARNQLQSLEREADRFRKESKSKDSQLSRLRQKLNNQDTQLTKHKQQLTKVMHDAEQKVSNADDGSRELRERVETLEEQLAEKTDEASRLRGSTRNHEEENAKFLHKKQREIEQGLNREQEFRYDLERKLVRATEECKSAVDNFETSQSELERASNALDKLRNDTESEAQSIEELTRKLQERTHRQREAESERQDSQQMCDDMQVKLHNTLEQVGNLQEALRKKAEREKHYKEREKKISDRERRVNQREHSVERKMEQYAERSNRKYESRSPRKLTTQKNRDPLYKMRTLLPWPWICMSLVILLFFGVLLRKNSF